MVMCPGGGVMMIGSTGFRRRASACGAHKTDAKTATATMEEKDAFMQTQFIATIMPAVNAILR